MSPSEIAVVIVCGLIACWLVFLGSLLLLWSKTRMEPGSERLGTILVAVGRILLGIGVGLVAFSEHGSLARLVALPAVLGSVFLMISGRVIARREQKRRKSSDRASTL
jgi:predicted Na+-dependent transporter